MQGFGNQEGWLDAAGSKSQQAPYEDNAPSPRSDTEGATTTTQRIGRMAPMESRLNVGVLQGNAGLRIGQLAN